MFKPAKFVQRCPPPPPPACPPPETPPLWLPAPETIASCSPPPKAKPPMRAELAANWGAGCSSTEPVFATCAFKCRRLSTDPLASPIPAEPTRSMVGRTGVERQNGSAPAHGDRCHLSGRRDRSMKCGRCTHIVQPSVPRTPATGLPTPTEPGRINPVAVVIGHPTPWIRRGPHVPHSGIPRPGAIHKRIPSSAHKIWLPHRPVARPVAKAAVVAQIAISVAVRSSIFFRVFIVIRDCLLVPLVVGVFLEILRLGG